MKNTSPFDSLSVVITAYNEEECLEVFTRSVYDYLKAKVKKFEIIIVNDGSTDTTAKRMSALEQEHSEIRGQHLVKNSGMGAALKVGFGSAHQEWLTFFPADGQIAPSELDKMLHHVDAQQLDCVATRYENRNYTLKRKMISLGLHGLTTLILGKDPRNQGIYALKKSTYQKLTLFSDTFLLNLEIPVKVQLQQFKFDSILISLSPRIAGVSKAMQKPRVFKTLFQMLKIRYKMIFSA